MSHTQNAKDLRRRKHNNRGFDWLLLAAAIVVIYFSSILVSQQVYLNQVGREQEAADKRLQAAVEVNEALKKERDELNDLGYIEKVAREELGMTKPDELPYSSTKRPR